MREWFSGYVNTNGMRMHYYRTRGDKPPLVLAHGATDSGLCWSRLARTLESTVSDAPSSGYTASDHAADLAGLIDALALRRTAVGGHSMGGGAALRLG
jgi:pimeloyl-ACP methyl ester carboxylesterase